MMISTVLFFLFTRRWKKRRQTRRAQGTRYWNVLRSSKQGKDEGKGVSRSTVETFATVTIRIN